MKTKTIYLFLILSTTVFAQLGTKHWIPPLHSRQELQVEDHYIYLSTPYTTPFQVTIKDGAGNTITAPVTISKGNPAIIPIGNGVPTTMFITEFDLNTVVTSGLILSGSKEFYCSFRVRSINQAETLISKGEASKGKEFRLGSLPMTSGGGARNFVASFMATENNTTITVSDYDTNVVFTGATNITDDTLTINLNAGQSYVISGLVDNGSPNLNGFVGAKVSANKDIVVNTGNALGGMNTPQNGQDFNLDQIVGYDKLGKEYLTIKGNGNDINEQILVIATANNTNIFVNGSATPLQTLVNEGDWTLIPANFYQGTGNHKNMYITSNNNIYVYQILAGSTSDATSGLNFIPPLSCFFQHEVDMIPDFDKIGNTQYQGNIFILTKTGSTVSVNGTAVTTTPLPAIGTNDWVTYKLTGYTGNVAVSSTGPLAVGAFGAASFAGYAGYYSGFGVNPKDTEIKVCSSKITDLLDAIDGNAPAGGTWTPPLSGGNNFNPNIDPIGVYNYYFLSDCAIIDVNVNVTEIVQAPNTGTDGQKIVCKNDPSFNLFNQLGGTPLTTGVWVPALASGTNMFNPSIDTSGAYKYTITSDGVCDEVFSTVTVTVNPLPIVSTITEYKICDDVADGNNTNGFSTFDLTTKTAEILNGQTNCNVSYHTSQANADANLSPITTIYSNGQTIYVRMQNTVTNCYTTTSFIISVLPVPNVNKNITLKQCDDDTDAISDFNLIDAVPQITTDTSLNYTFYTTLANAQAETNPILNPTIFTSGIGTVYATFSNANSCKQYVTINLVVSATQIPTNYLYKAPEVCDDYTGSINSDFDGIATHNFSGATAQITALFPPTQPINISYYKNLQDALAEQNAITNTTTYRNIGYPNQQYIYVRVDNSLNNECLGLGAYVFLKVNPVPIYDLGEDKILCVNPINGYGTLDIIAFPNIIGNYSFEWTPENPILINGNQHYIYSVNKEGTYTVKVTNNTTGCQFTDSINITKSSEPGQVKAFLITPLFGSSLATIGVEVLSGYGTYEYSLDGNNWQNSPTFAGLTNGIYTIKVRDKKGCGNIQISNNVATVSFPTYFTPNGDGYNDVWTIKGLIPEYKPEITVFDRYGKMLYYFNPLNQNGWTGNFNGKELPATDYWFRIDYTENGERKTFTSHFAMKR